MRFFGQDAVLEQLQQTGNISGVYASDLQAQSEAMQMLGQDSDDYQEMIDQAFADSGWGSSDTGDLTDQQVNSVLDPSILASETSSESVQDLIDEATGGAGMDSDSELNPDLSVPVSANTIPMASGSNPLTSLMSALGGGGGGSIGSSSSKGVQSGSGATVITLPSGSTSISSTTILLIGAAVVAAILLSRK